MSYTPPKPTKEEKEFSDLLKEYEKKFGEPFPLCVVGYCPTRAEIREFINKGEKYIPPKYPDNVII